MAQKGTIHVNLNCLPNNNHNSITNYYYYYRVLLIIAAISTCIYLLYLCFNLLNMAPSLRTCTTTKEILIIYLFIYYLFTICGIFHLSEEKISCRL